MGALSLVASLPWPLLFLQLLLTSASNLWLFTSSLLIYEVFAALALNLSLASSSASTWLLAPSCSTRCGGYQTSNDIERIYSYCPQDILPMHRWVWSPPCSSPPTLVPGSTWPLVWGRPPLSLLSRWLHLPWKPSYTWSTPTFASGCSHCPVFCELRPWPPQPWFLLLQPPSRSPCICPWHRCHRRPCSWRPHTTHPGATYFHLI